MTKQEILDYFEIKEEELNGVEILYSCYETPPYEGYAEIIYRKGNKLFTVSASHCSCYGLEGQWTPIEVTPETLKHLLTNATYGIYHHNRQQIEQALLDAGVTND